MSSRAWIVAAALALTPALDAQDRPQIGAIDEVIENLRAEGYFPGVAAAVTEGGVPIHVGTYGMASLENEVPITTQTVFELASLTKQMTALAVMELVEQGRLTLDSKVVDYVDGAPAGWTKLTVRQLLAHMGGLAHHFERTIDGVHLLEYSRDDMLASAMATPMVAEPGTDWEYSDQGYFLLGVMVEAVTGRCYAEFMRETYFEPLGMAQTHLLDQRRIVPHRAQGYALVDGAMERNRRVWQFALTPHFGVMSSLDDMLRWEAELADPDVVSRDALEATWEIQRTFDTGTSCVTWGYGRGWWVMVVDGRRFLSHAGYSGTAYVRDVDRGLSAIVLTNREDTTDAISPLALAWAALHEVDPAIPAAGLECWR